MKNVAGKFQSLPRFPKKMVLYSLTKFDFFSLVQMFLTQNIRLKALTNIKTNL